MQNRSLTEKFDVRLEITNKIISYLENGIKPWECHYFNSIPMNFFTKKMYSGINVLYLNTIAIEKEFKSNKWLSYRQALNLGGNIKKGEKGTPIVFYSVLEKENDKNEIEKILFLKHFNIFNVDQCENIVDSNDGEVLKSDMFEKIDSFISKIGADISISNNERPSYNKTHDKIHMPPKFTNLDRYYSTLFHELSHWTGHETRLNRFSKLAKFGSEAYAFEELIAEIGSAYLGGHFGLNITLENHASYISSWLEVLKKDKKFIFLAAAKAQEIINFLKINPENEELSF